MQYFASRIFNPDSFGMDFTGYLWKGVVIDGDVHQIVCLEGAGAMKAYTEAKCNMIYEMALTTGAIAAPCNGYETIRSKKPKKKKK